MKYFLSIFFTVLVLTSVGQKLKPTSTNDFALECMKNNGEHPRKQMVLWFPYNFWQIVGEQMKISPEFVQILVKEMSKYMMFAVVDYNISQTGLTFKSEDEIRKSIKLYDSSRNIYFPIEPKNISPTATQLIKSLHPTMAQMLGQFGDGMRVFLFDAKQANGKPVIDITKANNFTLSWEAINIKWTLPFASILPFKYCPVDNEQMKGNWNYCPIHGSKLNQ